MEQTGEHLLVPQDFLLGAKPSQLQRPLTLTLSMERRAVLDKALPHFLWKWCIINILLEGTRYSPIFTGTH